jgi:uncharacterized protein (TIGR04255 family)
MTKLMSAEKRNPSPLQEAIFELHWALEETDLGVLHDKDFDLAIGIFKDRVKTAFPVHERLQSASTHPIRMLGIPSHQFWKKDYQSPVLQFGPGVLTVNDIGADYAWKGRYKDAVKMAIKHWEASYSERKVVESIRLQYLNGVDIGTMPPDVFVDELLQTRIHNGFGRPGKVGQFAIAQAFELEDGSTLTLNISNGKNNTTGVNSVFFRIILEKSEGEIPVTSIMAWTTFAHAEISKFFKDLLHPSYYERFF